MKGSFIKNTSFYALGNVLPQAVGFLLLPIYTHYLTPEDYGIVSSMQVLNTILIILFTLAVDRSVYRLFFDYNTEKDRRAYLGTITISIFIISVIILALLFAFNNVVSTIYSSINFYPFYVYAILTSFFTVFSLVPKIYFQINEKALMFVSISIVQFLLNTGFVLFFIVHMKLGAKGMLEGNVIANAILVPFFLWITYKTVSLKFNIEILKASLKFSLPMIPSLLSAWVLNLSDRVFIERYFNLHDVGVYSLGYKIAGIVLIFTGAFNMAYNPVFYQLANSEKQKKAKETLRNYNFIYILVILIIVFIITLFSKDVVVLFLDANYIEAYKIIPIIALGYLISQASGIFNLMIYQEKKTQAVMIITIVSALINIGLNFLLIPYFGIYGAAYATVLSFLVVFIFSFFYAKRCYYIPVEWRRLGVIFSLFLAIYYVFSVTEVNVLYLFIVKIIVIFLIMVFILKRYSVQIKNMLSDY